MSAPDIESALALAAAYLAGGISFPLHADTTVKLAESLLELARLSRAHIEALKANRELGYTGREYTKPTAAEAALRDALGYTDPHRIAGEQSMNSLRLTAAVSELKERRALEHARDILADSDLWQWPGKLEQKERAIAIVERLLTRGNR